MGVELESGETKRQTHGSSSSKKSRAAEVHNLSERRRRDRINEKMRSLQELIPHCNKADKASMLDEAIEYMKSLQLQVQMMSMGYGMVPMMYPGAHPYMAPMCMGMGMDAVMSRPMVPYPHFRPSLAMVNPAAAAHHMGPMFPMQAFPVPPVMVSDPSAVGVSKASESTQNSLVTDNANQSQFPNFVDPYQHFVALNQHQTQLLASQQLAAGQTITEEASSSVRLGKPEDYRG